MKSTAPHYLLFTQANDRPGGPHHREGRWKFVLEEIGTDVRIEESDGEPNVRGERLQLLAVIRGLESLDQPSRVTLITPSRHVGFGLRSGLRQWKLHDWQHEVDGSWETIPHLDYWMRIEKALTFHQLSCRVWHFDAPHDRIQVGKSKPKRRTTPFVSSFEEAGLPSMLEQRSTRPNRIRISEDVRSRFFENRQESAARTQEMLGVQVKPIGHGRAYGYAIN